MTALEYLQSKGLEYRIQSGQAVLKTCPFCGDQKSHFYVDPDEGAFYCHKCQERGNLVTLKKHYGDLFIDFTRKLVWGIDGILVKAHDFTSNAVNMKLEKLSLKTRAIIKARNPPENRVEICLNGTSIGMKTKDEFETGFECSLDFG